MTKLDKALERYTNNAEYERTHGNLQGCLEFRQLVEWLKDYKRLKEQEPCEDATLKDIFCMGCEYKKKEHILDKIRAEIEQTYCKVINDYDHGRNYGLYLATEIIDKYKAESEGEK